MARRPAARSRVAGASGCPPHKSPIGLAAGCRERAEPIEQVVADAKRAGDRGQARVNRARGREEARDDDVEVVEVVHLAVDVERRAPGIDAEAYGPAVVRDPGERDLLAKHRPPRDAGSVAAERAEHVLQLGHPVAKAVAGDTPTRGRLLRTRGDRATLGTAKHGPQQLAGQAGRRRMHLHCRHSIATRHARATGVARSCRDSGGSGPAGVALVVCATTPSLYLRPVVAPCLESRHADQFSAGEIARRHRAAGNPPCVVRIIRSLLSGGWRNEHLQLRCGDLLGVERAT